MAEPAHLTLRSSGPDDTRALAAAAAPVLHPGDVVSLTGELGAGKTCFVQGAARELGITDRVTSPTFMLVKTYAGTLPIVHCDVYRLDTLQDVYDLGDEVMSPSAVTFVEWGDAVAALLPDDRLDVELLIDDPDDVDADRLIHLRGRGRWRQRLPQLEAACDRWVDRTAAGC
jgi:tRNA threonylcarbamoyladenosine biosynthesis protein TsaE